MALNLTPRSNPFENGNEMIIQNADGKIWLAIKSRLDAWTETPVMMPKETYVPTVTGPFIIAQHVTTQYGGLLPIQVDCGIPLVGFMSLGVCAPTDWQYPAHIGLASRLADHFADGSRMTYQDISVQVTQRSRPLGTVSLEPPFNRLEVRVDWRAWG